MKPKDLMGMPWRMAFALQDDGWYLRSDIIWHKPNPMPESVWDRPTKSHEYIFLLTKSPRYFYDAEAIMETVSVDTHPRAKMRTEQDETVPELFPALGTNNGEAIERGAQLPPIELRTAVKTGERERFVKYNSSLKTAMIDLVSKRNKRSVWTVSTYGFKEAHFATYPPDLIKPCILAGTSAHGCCVECGSPWRRIIEKGGPELAHQIACGGDRNGNYNGHATKDYASAKAQNASEVKARILAGMKSRKTVGWEPTCKCNVKEVEPAVVLDPFGGSGTTGQVAIELGRRAVLIELNPEYVEIIRNRTAVTPGLKI